MDIDILQVSDEFDLRILWVKFDLINDWFDSSILQEVVKKLGINV